MNSHVSKHSQSCLTDMMSFFTFMVHWFPSTQLIPGAFPSITIKKTQLALSKKKTVLYVDGTSSPNNVAPEKEKETYGFLLFSNKCDLSNSVSSSALN